MRPERLPHRAPIRLRHLLLGALLVVAPGLPARGADQTVQGTQLVVKDRSTLEKRKITVKAKEVSSDDTLVGNPVADGATVRIAVNGATPSSDTYTLPAGASWTGDASKGFKYADPKGANGPVRTAQLKLRKGVFTIKIVVEGKLGPVAIVPPSPGSDGCVLVTIGGGDSYSIRFAGGELTNQGAVLFKIVKPTGEGSCVSTTTSTSTTTTSSTSTTSTTLGLPFVMPPGDAPLRYRDPVFAGVTTTSDLVYGSAVNLSNQTVTLTFDLYEPTGDVATARPMVVWVHGGSFAGGDKTSPELVDEATVFSQKGYVNASINYRLEPPGCTASTPTVQCVQAIYEAFADAQTAVRFFRTNAATYGVDGTRIAMGGSSAGAITALNVGFGSSEDPTAAVAAAVSLSGARLLGTVDPNDAPSMLFHGTADTVVPYEWAVNTYDDAIAVGLDSFLTSWAGAGHVPYLQHRTEILDQTTNFLYWEMDLTNAPQ